MQFFMDRSPCLTMEGYSFSQIINLLTSRMTSNTVTDLYELMKNRRTTRHYSTECIDPLKVERIIQAGIYAPSGSNKSPYLIAVVTNPQLKSEIRKRAESVEREFYRNKRKSKDNEFLKWVQKKDIRITKSFLTDAPVLLVVFENSEWADRHSLESTWISIGYMILAAEYEGLSTVTYTPEPKTFLNEILEIPEVFRPQVILPLGYAKDSVKKKGIRPELSKRILTFT
ncbi:MAG: hypothetical protein D6732_06190 [Methanobacteriota archaeon]|nr:MAG: hypothetical protein D6732_06190 [Euryarchaeota archaeon]